MSRGHRDLGDGRIQVVTVDLDEPVPFERARALLSPDECQRADRFRVEPAARRFTLARAVLRTLLSDALGATPGQLTFAYGTRGKPGLEGQRLRFNVSHSKGLALFALAHDVELGVDVEKERDVPGALDIARRMFAPSEYEALAALDAPHQAAAFLRGWTRKEAFVKTTGDGLQLPLHAFEVNFVDPTEPARLLRVPAPERPFRMVGLQPAPRSWGALCWEGPERPVEIRSRPLAELIRSRGL